MCSDMIKVQLHRFIPFLLLQIFSKRILPLNDSITDNVPADVVSYAVKEGFQIAFCQGNGYFLDEYVLGRVTAIFADTNSCHKRCSLPPNGSDWSQEDHSSFPDLKLFNALVACM